MTIDQLEAELARYEALYKADALRLPVRGRQGTRFTENIFTSLAATKTVIETTKNGKHREAARKEYEIRLPQIVHELRKLNPGK